MKKIKEQISTSIKELNLAGFIVVKTNDKFTIYKPGLSIKTNVYIGKGINYKE
jgi:hypothetical protein